jgi:hypothetical protein
MSLSTLIVQREIASIREVEEALARQVLYGGDFVTNLLEVCRLDEAVLVSVVAESIGLPPAPPGELPRPDREAQRLVAAEVAVERNLAALTVDRYGLTVAVAAPLDADVEQELSFALALPIAQRIAPLVRIKQALARDYGVPLDRRLQRLLQRMMSTGTSRQSSYPPPMRNADIRLGAPRPPSLIPAAPHTKPSEPVRPAMPSGGGARTLLRETTSPSMRPLRRRRGAITVEGARAELAEAAERDTIFDLLFEFGRQYFDYTAVFIVHGEVAEGRDAFGDGAPRDRVARIGVPLDLPSILSAAREKKATIQRVPAPDGLDAVLMSDLGRSGKTVCAVLPVVVRSRVVALLLGDGGETGIDAATLADVDGVVGQATAAFERLIVRRKLRGSNMPAGMSDSSAPPGFSLPPPTNLSGLDIRDRPSVEELAPPIRDLMAEPQARAAATMREPKVESVVPAAVGPAVGRGMRDTPPPPPTMLQVHRPSGRPIPREEPESRSRLVAESPSSGAVRAGGASSPARGRGRRGEAPKLEFGAAPAAPSMFGDTFGNDEAERQLLAEIHGRSFDAAPAPSSEVLHADDSDVSVVDRGGHAVFDDDDAEATPIAPAVRSLAADMMETPLAPAVSELVVPVPAGRAMPASEQQISVALHRPPSSRGEDLRVLPSVIVDVASEYVALVERVVSGQMSTDDAEAELLRAGGHAMPAIMARFPGPVTIEPDRLAGGPLPRVAECGPVLRLVASQRRTALPFVLSHVEDPDVEKRFWATYLLTELVYPDVLEHILLRVYDDEPRIRRAARAAARAFADGHPKVIVERLELVAMDGGEPRARRALAIEALGETREALAVPALVPLLDDPDTAVTAAVRGALMTIARQDFGTSSQSWRAWWEQNEGRHRLEWLIDALMHEHAALRAAAGEELKTITKEYFGYYDDLPKRERERAQSRYREWWTTVGRVRFSRASSARP